MSRKGNAKLEWEDAVEIRRLREVEGWTIPEIARRYLMSENQISRICHYTAWRKPGAETPFIGPKASLARMEKLMGPDWGKDLGKDLSNSELELLAKRQPREISERARSYGAGTGAGTGAGAGTYGNKADDDSPGGIHSRDSGTSTGAGERDPADSGPPETDRKPE